LSYFLLSARSIISLISSTSSESEILSTIVTTNIVLSRWGELFQSPEIATAILDRLVHHVKVFKITGKSYRMKNNL